MNVLAEPYTRGKVEKSSNDFPYYLILFFLFLEYGRPQSLFPVIGKFHLGMLVQILLFLLLVLKNKILNFKNIQTKCFIGLLLLMALHVPIAVNNYWAFTVLKNITLYFIVYLSIISFVNSYSKIIKYINIWITINLLCAIIGLKYGGLVPNSSFMGDENDFSLVMNMAIPFAYFVFLEAKSVKIKIFNLAAICTFIAASVASLSRGGFVGLVAVGIYCWLKTPKKILATILIAIMIGFFSFVATDKFWKEVISIREDNIEKGTGYGRWYMWNCAWQMFLDHPVIGVGQDNFRWNIQPYEPLNINVYSFSRAGKAVHSLYFTLLPELGIIGIILFSSMICLSYNNNRFVHGLDKKTLSGHTQNKINNYQREFFSKHRKFTFLSNGINGALVGYMVSGIFLSVLYYPHFWLLIALNTAMQNIVQKEIGILQIQI